MIDYRRLMTKIAIENGQVEIVSFPMKHRDLSHSYVNVYQRVFGNGVNIQQYT